MLMLMFLFLFGFRLIFYFKRGRAASCFAVSCLLSRRIIQINSLDKRMRPWSSLRATDNCAPKVGFFIANQAAAALRDIDDEQAILHLLSCSRRIPPLSGLPLSNIQLR